MSPTRNAKSPVRTSARRAAATQTAVPVVEVETVAPARSTRGRSRSTAPAASRSPRSPSKGATTSNNNSSTTSTKSGMAKCCAAWNSDILQAHFKQVASALLMAVIAGSMTFWAAKDHRFVPQIESLIAKGLLCLLKPLGITAISPRAFSVILLGVAVAYAYGEGLLLDWCPPLKKSKREFNMTTLMSSVGIIMAAVTAAFHVGLAEGRIVHLLIVFLSFRKFHYLSGMLCLEWISSLTEVGGAFTAFTLLFQSILKAH